MTIFGASRLGRIGYAILLILLFGFDFAKAPIERGIMSLHDAAAHDLMEPRVVAPGEAAQPSKINGKTMPFMLKGQEDAIRAIVASQKTLSKAEIEARLKSAAENTMLSLQTNQKVDPETQNLVDQRSAYAILFPIAVIIMTGITIIGLLYSVSSRLRDIGWPQYLLWIMLAPIFLPKLIALPLPAVAVQVAGLFFYTALLGLAFIPGKDNTSFPKNGRTSLPRAYRTNVEPVVRKHMQGQFGRAGTR